MESPCAKPRSHRYEPHYVKSGLSTAPAVSGQRVLPACHALERVIVNEHYLIPQYFSAAHRMVYSAWRLERPQIAPPYINGEPWVIDNWWARQPPLTAASKKP